MWAKENKMKMHPAKTKYSIISTRQKIANSAKQSLDLSVDGMQLTKVESERVLGVYIDSHLTWNEHIDTLRRKLLQRIAILARARKYIPTKYRLLLYNASIKLLFTYCMLLLPPQGFRPEAKSRGGTLVTRAHIKDSTYRSNIQSVY